MWTTTGDRACSTLPSTQKTSLKLWGSSLQMLCSHLPYPNLQVKASRLLLSIKNRLWTCAPEGWSSSQHLTPTTRTCGRNSRQPRSRWRRISMSYRWAQQEKDPSKKQKLVFSLIFTFLKLVFLFRNWKSWLTLTTRAISFKSSPNPCKTGPPCSWRLSSETTIL